MWREKPKKCYLCNNENAYGQGRVESDPEVVLKKRKVGLFGKQEHKNISRPQPWKLVQNMTKSKKNTTKTRNNHTRITSSSLINPVLALRGMYLDLDMLQCHRVK